MQKRFEVGVKYSGEIVYGACSSINTNCIVVLERDDDMITYQMFFGKSMGDISKARVETLDDWGEYIALGEDRVFAYSVENV